MSQKIISYCLEELPEIIRSLATELKNAHIIALQGPLGVGKTTIVKELLRTYGIQEEIVSPTFAYVNIYKNAQAKTFYHFDLYRLKNIGEFLEAGFDEYLHMPNSMVFIEWPEVIVPLLHKGVCWLSLDYLDAEKRKITINCF